MAISESLKMSYSRCFPFALSFTMASLLWLVKLCSTRYRSNWQLKLYFKRGVSSSLITLGIKIRNGLSVKLMLKVTFHIIKIYVDKLQQVYSRIYQLRQPHQGRVTGGLCYVGHACAWPTHGLALQDRQFLLSMPPSRLPSFQLANLGFLDCEEKTTDGCIPDELSSSWDATAVLENLVSSHMTYPW